MKTKEIVEQIRAGKRLFQLHTLAEKTNFYSACTQAGRTGSTKTMQGYWQGVVNDFGLAQPREALAAESTKSSAPEQAPARLEWVEEREGMNRMELRFVKSDKPTEMFPEEWYFYAPDYHRVMQPRWSMKPFNCVTPLLMTRAEYEQRQATMPRGCTREGELLPWKTSFARCFLSMMLPLSSVDGSMIDKAYEGLKVVDGSTSKEEFMGEFEKAKAQLAQLAE
jgi:hypothetical protein